MNWNLGLDNPAPVALAWTASGNLATVLASAALAQGSGTAPLKTWAVVSSNMEALASDPATPNGLYAAGASGLFHSGDGGISWTAVPLPGTPLVTAVAANGSGAIVGTGNGQLLATIATTLTTPVAGSAITALASNADASQLWLAAELQLWSSSDGGAQWQAQLTPFGPVSAIALSPLNPKIIAVLAPTGVALSWSGGNGWTRLDSGLPSGLPLTAIAWDANGVLWAATYGQGVWNLSSTASTFNLTLSISVTAAVVGSGVPFTLNVASAQGPLAAATVTVSVAVNGSSGASQTVTTASDGSASGVLTMPAQTGTATVIASWAGSAQPLLSNPQQLQLTAGTAAALAVVSGANQQQTAGQVLSQPVVVQLSDAAGNGLSGQKLVVTGPDNFTQDLTTDANGRAQLVAYRLPASPGPVTLAVAFASLNANWSETALPLPDYRISVSAPAAAAAAGATAVMALQVIPIGLFSSAVSLTCLPVPGCTIIQAGQPIAALAPGTPATVELNVGTLGSAQSSITVTVQADPSHLASVSVPLQSLNVALGAPSATLSAGQTAQVPVTVSGVNGLAAQISLAVAGTGGAPLSTLDAALQPAAVN
ncbi:MAG: WD40/YVTN/BNR-like repeat-containing protein, partial [Terriglobales bacterium]